MSDLSVDTKTLLVIKKDYGITHALKAHLDKDETVKNKPQKISLKQWHATMDKLVEIQNQRIANNQAPIFTGGTDKSSKAYRTSFVVQPNQNIEFTAEEMKALYAAMGVTVAETQKEDDKKDDAKKADKNNADNKKADDKKAADKKAKAQADSLRLVQQQVTADSLRQVREQARLDSLIQVKNDSIAAAQKKITLQNDSIIAAQKKNAVQNDSTEIVAADTLTVTNPVQGNTKADRYSLSWGQIGKIGATSAKDFVKGMFCDEEGFSWTRTVGTVATVVVLAKGGKIVKLLGGGTKLVNGVNTATRIGGIGLSGYMTTVGGANAVKGYTGYFNSTTEEEAKASMSQAMDGTIEGSLGAAGLIGFGKALKNGKSTTSKGGKGSATGEAAPTKDAIPTEVKPAEVKPAELKPAELKPAEPRPVDEFDFSVELPAKPASNAPKEFDFSVEPPNAVATADDASRVVASVDDAIPFKPASPKNYCKIKKGRTKSGDITKSFLDTKGRVLQVVTEAKDGTWKSTVDNIYQNGKKVGSTHTYPDGTVYTFKKGAPHGVKTTSEGRQYKATIDEFGNIKDTGIEITPETVVNKGVNEVKPAEVKPAEVKPAEVIDYNKPVKFESTRNNGNIRYNANGDPVYENSQTKGAEFTTTYQYDAKGNMVKSVHDDIAKGFIETVEYGADGVTKVVREVKGSYIDEFTTIADKSKSGVRTYKDGKKVNIKDNGNGVIELDVISEGKAANSEVKPAEVKPAEGAKEAKKPAQEAKTEPKPTEAAIDYNKVVKTETTTDSFGCKHEISYNAKGKVIKKVQFDKKGGHDHTFEYEYDANGVNTARKYIDSKRTHISTTYYAPDGKTVIKVVETWKDYNEVEVFTKFTDKYREGVQTKADGSKVRIRRDLNTHETTELGPVETPVAEVKPVEAKPVSSQGISTFQTSGGKSFTLDNSMSKAFKITQTSPDEAIISMTDDAGIAQELLSILNAFTEKGTHIMDFTQTTAMPSRLYMNKPGKLKLVDGVWKLVEPMKTSDAPVEIPQRKPTWMEGGDIDAM